MTTPKTPPCDPAQKPAGKNAGRREVVCTVREVPGALAVSGEVRAQVLGAFRGAGGSLDRWCAADRATMAHELTRVEDADEYAGRTAARARLRPVRRRLEDGAETLHTA